MTKKILGPILGETFGSAEGKCLFGSGSIELGLVDRFKGEVRADAKVLSHRIDFIMIVNFTFKELFTEINTLDIKKGI